MSAATSNGGSGPVGGASGGAAPGGAASGTAGTAPAGVEARIARLLTVGTRIAVGLLAVGSVLLVAAGISPLASSWPPFDPASLPADLLALRPEGFLWLGLLVTIATPLLRVTAATLGFARAGERRMVVLGIAVLVVIFLAVVAGVAAG
jgi:uncharacterized membrane protein